MNLDAEEAYEHSLDFVRKRKNRFILLLCSWTAFVGFSDSVKLYFFIAGHTKNECDGELGGVKEV